MIAAAANQLATSQTVRLSLGCLFGSSNLEHQISNFSQSHIFIMLQTLYHFLRTRPFVFNTFRTLSLKNTRGGVPRPQLKDKK